MPWGNSDEFVIPAHAGIHVVPAPGQPKVGQVPVCVTPLVAAKLAPPTDTTQYLGDQK